MPNRPIAHPRVLDCAYIDIDTLYEDFHIPQQGYHPKQVEESRNQYGKNVLLGRASDTALYRLRRAFINPFTIILFVLAAVSVVVHLRFIAALLFLVVCADAGVCCDLPFFLAGQRRCRVLALGGRNGYHTLCHLSVLPL